MARPAKVTAAFKSEVEDGLTSIMFMPEGTHEITAMIGGRVQTREVNVDQSVLAAFQDGLDARKEKNVRPFGGFDHKTGEAAFIPQAFRYEEGRGLMLDIEWTEAGQKAVEGRNYSYFSPTFALKQDGTPSGIFATGEIGSLVNEPAFQEIERIAAAQAEESDEEKVEADGRGHMLHELGLIEEAEIESEDAMEIALRRIEDFRKAEAALASNQTETVMSEDIEKAQAAQKEAEAKKVKAEAALEKLQGEHDELQSKLDKVEAEAKAQAEKSADEAIEAAVKAGRIAPKDEDLQAFWKRTVLGDPEAYKALASLPAAPIDGKTIVAHKGAEQKEEPKGFQRVVAAFEEQSQD